MLDTYIPMKDIVEHLDINEGDRLFISSDVKRLMYSCIEHQDETDLNQFIDALEARLGPQGTILFPTYNWDFCKGKTFDYRTTKCKTGALGSLALKRPDFVRTRHPIYSFAVWGKDAEYLYSLDNKSSFGADSPFAYFHKNAVRNLLIDVTYRQALTYVHHVEEMVGTVGYRYMKDFTAEYVDNAGNTSTRTYSMFVRDLDMDVQHVVNPLRDDFIAAGIEQSFWINQINYKLLDMGKAYEIIEKDIRSNRSKKVCSYIGQ